jgi:glycosyltransferase involved in cell wall biosynthesis
MNNVIIFFSFLNIWSINDGEGAPSFYNTIRGYIDDGWEVYLIKPSCGDGITKKITGLHIMRYHNNFLWKLCKIKRVSFGGRILNSIYGSYKLYLIGKRIIEAQLGANIVLYAYEVNGVAAAKRLHDKYGYLFVSRFQGTVLYSVKDTFYNRLRWYPHFHALQTQADVVIMTDDGTFGYDTLKRLNNKSRNILFLKNGINSERISKFCEETMNIKAKYGFLDSEVVLMTVSRLASWKRVDRAITALYFTKKYYKECKLVIIGDGDEREKLEYKAKMLNVESDVVFTGAIKQNEVRYYLPLSTIFLSLYDIGNVGNPLFEAMSASKPIITINNGDTASVIKNYENGILLEPNEINDVYKYILELIYDDDLRDRLGTNARNYIERDMCSWDDRIRYEIQYIKQHVAFGTTK